MGEEVVRQNPGQVIRSVSPLAYRHGYPVMRLAVRDTSVPESTDQTYFADTTRTTRRGPTGRELKHPRQELIPGAGDPHIVAFLDWHFIPHEPKPAVYIDYVRTREDLKRKGYARTLLDELLLENEDAAWIDFGEIFHDDAWRYYQKRKAEGWRVFGKLR